MTTNHLTLNDPNRVRWDHQLTFQGRRKALGRVGRALGLQYQQWHDLPGDVRAQLTRLWNEDAA